MDKKITWRNFFLTSLVGFFTFILGFGVMYLIARPSMYKKVEKPEISIVQRTMETSYPSNPKCTMSLELFTVEDGEVEEEYNLLFGYYIPITNDKHRQVYRNRSWWYKFEGGGY